MITRFLLWALLKLRGSEDMIEMFFAQREILDKTKFSKIPAVLQPGVREILVDSGLVFLVNGE